MAVGELFLWNPGEPVFDQTTGEPYIDAEGGMVEVVPGSKVIRDDGTTLDGDDVANAAWLRASLFQGDCLRAADVGVPYLSQVLGQSNQGLAAATVAGEVKARTPGVAGIVAVAVQGIDPASRVLSWSASLLRKDGNETTVSATTTG